MQKPTYRRVRMDSAQHWRIRLTALVLGLLGFLGVAARLAQLMVVDYDYYAAKALNNQTRSTAAASDRGLVYDRNMNILASNVPTLFWGKLDPLGSNSVCVRVWAVAI